MAKAKDNAATEDRKVAKSHPDYKLIKACVEYAFTMGAAHTAYKVDPTDATFAAAMDSHRLMHGYELLAKAAKLQPVTFDGLSAKAATAAMICDPLVLDRIGEDEAPFIRSLAADVVRFHKLAGGKHSASPTHKTFAEGIANG